MVDVIPTPEELERLASAAEEIERLNEAYRKQSTILSDNSRYFMNVSSGIDKSNMGMLGFVRSTSQADQAIARLIANVSNGFGIDISDGINKASGYLRKFGPEALAVVNAFTNIVPLNTRLFGDFGQAGQKAGFDISAAFNEVKEKLGPLGEPLGRLVDSAQMAQGLEMGLLGVATASGDLNLFLDETGQKFEGLSDATARYNEKIYQTAVASGMLPSTVAAYANNLAKIPGALREQISVSTDLGTTIDMLNASIKVASAFGIDHGQVVNQLDFAYRKFGTTGESALEFVTNLAQSAQDTKTPLDLMRSSVEGIANSLKMFHDNTRGAINVAAAFGDVLRNSGIGPEAIQELAQTFTSAIGKMDIAQKAFISGAAGGPGGVFGGLKIDFLLQQGNIDEVVNMTTKALQRTSGGRVVTLQDVMNRPELTGALMQQTALIRQFGLAGDQQSAYRILEAMKSGVGAAAVTRERQVGRTPQDILNDSLRRGQSIQERNNNELVKFTTELQRANQILTQINQSMVMRARGTRMGEEMVQAGRRGAQTGAIGAVRIGEAAPPGQEFVTLQTRETEFRKDFEDKTRQAFNNVKNMATRHLSGAVAAGGGEIVEGMVNVQIEKIKSDIGTATEGTLRRKARELGMETPAGTLTAPGLEKLRQNILKRTLESEISPAEQLIAPQTVTEIQMTQPQRATTALAPAAFVRQAPNQQTSGVIVPRTGDRFIKVEVDIKDGITTIARKVVDERLGAENRRGTTGNAN